MLRVKWPLSCLLKFWQNGWAKRIKKRKAKLRVKNKIFNILTRSFASRFLLRFAQPFLPKFKPVLFIHFSLYKLVYTKSSSRKIFWTSFFSEVKKLYRSYPSRRFANRIGSFLALYSKSSILKCSILRKLRTFKFASKFWIFSVICFFFCRTSKRRFLSKLSTRLNEKIFKSLFSLTQRLRWLIRLKSARNWYDALPLYKYELFRKTKMQISIYMFSETGVEGPRGPVFWEIYYNIKDF